MSIHAHRYHFTATIAPIVSVSLLLMTAFSGPASAGPLRFLFGGGDIPQRNGEVRREHSWEDRKYPNRREWSSRQHVAFDSRYDTGTIIVSFTDRYLYYVTQPGQAIRYLIGTPTGDAEWSGESVVSEKRVNPRWIPTAEMRAEDPRLPAQVPGGHPRNPLGVRALYLGDTLYRIHGTDAPSTVGREVSNGCIRLYNSDIIDLYKRATIGTPVVVTWKSFRNVGSASPRGSVLSGSAPDRASIPQPEPTTQARRGWNTTVRGNRR